MAAQTLALGLALDAAREARRPCRPGDRRDSGRSRRGSSTAADPCSRLLAVVAHLDQQRRAGRRPVRRSRRDRRRAGSPSGRCRCRRRRHRDRASPARAGRGTRCRCGVGRSRRTIFSSTRRPPAVSAIRNAFGSTWQISRSTRAHDTAGFSSFTVSNSGRPDDVAVGAGEEVDEARGAALDGIAAGLAAPFAALRGSRRSRPRSSRLKRTTVSTRRVRTVPSGQPTATPPSTRWRRPDSRARQTPRLGLGLGLGQDAPAAARRRCRRPARRRRDDAAPRRRASTVAMRKRIGARQLARGGRFVDVGGIDLGGLESDLSQQVEPAR